MPSATIARPPSHYERLVSPLNHIPSDLLLLVARLSIASVFFLSGRTKVDGILQQSRTAVGHGWMSAMLTIAPELVGQVEMRVRGRVQVSVRPCGASRVRMASTVKCSTTVRACSFGCVDRFRRSPR